MYHSTLGAAMTAEQQAAYARAMQEAGRTAARAAGEPHTYKERSARYATLKAVQYPPPPPPIVADAVRAASSASSYAAAAAAATSAAAATTAADAAATEAIKAKRKAAGAPTNLDAKAAAASADASLKTAAAAVSKWTKQPIATVQQKLEQSGAAQADLEAKMNAGGLLSMLNGAAEMWGKARLDWRFWTGVGAALYGTWLRTRR